MRKKFMALIALAVFGCMTMVAQGRANIIKYISENKLYRSGNEVTITNLDLEWPVSLGGKSMPALQKKLCEDLLKVNASNMQSGWTEFHNKLGTEIRQMPDLVKRHNLYLKLHELWLENGRYISFYFKRQEIDGDGTQHDGLKQFFTYDIANDEILSLDETFSQYTDEYNRVAFETLLEQGSVCDDNDKPNIDLTVLPEDFAVLGDAMMIGLGGPIDHDDYSVVSVNNLYQLGLFKHSFVRWIQGKGKTKKNPESFVMPTDFDSSLSSDTITYNVSSLPTFPGSKDSLMAFIRNNVHYPNVDLALHNQGRVILSFIVEKDGSLSDVTVVSPLSPGLDRESVRVIRLMPKWKPAELDGNKVRTRMTLPMTFRFGNDQR